jgi:hypothetical protein
MSSAAVPMLIIYRIKPESETEFRELLAKHWPTLRDASLVTDEPAQVWRAVGKDGGLQFVERFSWADRSSSDVAHQTPEVMQIWEPMGPHLVGMEMLQLESVA